MKWAFCFRPQLGAALISMLVLGVMIALFHAARETDPARYNAAEETLRQIKELDAAVNEDALELRFGLQLSCDAFNEKLTTLSALRAQLKANLAVLETRFPAQMQHGLAEADRQWEIKQSLAEQFKTSNAVLSNSRYYFPEACMFVRRHYAQQAAWSDLTADLTALEHDILLQNMCGEPTLSAAVLARIRRLQAKEAWLGQAALWDLHSLLLHAKMLVQSKQRVDKHLSALIAVPSASAYDPVIAGLEQLRHVQFLMTNRYRAALFLVGLLVFAYALAVFRTTRRQARELFSANETLESRVIERTQDLQCTNAELRQSEQRFRKNDLPRDQGGKMDASPEPTDRARVVLASMQDDASPVA